MQTITHKPKRRVTGGTCSLILQVTAFDTAIGSLALLWTMDGVRRLTLGHDSPAEALETILPQGRGFPEIEIVTRPRGALETVVKRLQRYAEQGNDDFCDIAVAHDPMTAFQRAVVQACRQIAPGQTLSYAQLAEAVGAPGAARAVGNCMRTNKVPLIIPCHRVIGAGGGLGGYSAPQGLALKRRLLALEGVAAFI